jgi:HK97 family phage prohead protease
MKIEHYGFGIEDLEIKLAENDTGTKVGHFKGYGSVFNVIDAGGDLIKQGAFSATLADWAKKGKMPPMLLQHGGFYGSVDDMLPLGKWLSMEEDRKGLKVEGELYALDTERGTYVYEGLKARTLDGLSIGYQVKTSTMGSKPSEPRRTLIALDLKELSIVVYPMNDKARISSVKSIEECDSLSDFEENLRDSGYSRSKATAFMSRIKSVLNRPSDSETAKSELAEMNKSIRELISRLRE